MKLPLYKAIINANDWDTGCYRVSLVQDPATEKPWVTFSKDDEKKAPMKFSIENEEQHMVRGVLMLADTPIYRRNGDYEYYITFYRDTLKTMAQKMLRLGYANDLNTDHEDSTWVQGMYMTEIFVKDSSSGMVPNGFDDVPDGSLLATYYVDSNDIWNRIKEGVWSGFSIEAWIDLEEVSDEDDEEFSEILALCEKIKNKFKKND